MTQTFTILLYEWGEADLIRPVAVGGRSARGFVGRPSRNRRAGGRALCRLDSCRRLLLSDAEAPPTPEGRGLPRV